MERHRGPRRTNMGFEGKVALVTGGGSGIGAAISKELAAQGVGVVVTDIKLEAAQATVDEITKAGGEAAAFEGNTAVADDSRKAVEFAVSTFGGLNYAVNNAGIGGKQAPTEIGRASCRESGESRTSA